MEIELTTAEIKLAHFMGKERNAIHRKRETPETRRSGRPQEDCTADGFAGELAVCRVLNCYPNMSNLVADGGVDFMSFGVTIDNKNFTWMDDRCALLVEPKCQYSPAEWYCMTRGALPIIDGKLLLDVPVKIEICGFIAATEVFLASRLEDRTGHGEEYTVDREELQPVKDWLELMESIDGLF